jgi:hypothetical protein
MRPSRAILFLTKATHCLLRVSIYSSQVEELQNELRHERALIENQVSIEHACIRPFVRALTGLVAWSGFYTLENYNSAVGERRGTTGIGAGHFVRRLFCCDSAKLNDPAT